MAVGPERARIAREEDTGRIAELAAALDAAPTISTGCLEIALKRGRNGNGYQPTDPSPNTVNGAPIGASHATLDRPPASRRVI